MKYFDSINSSEVVRRISRLLQLRAEGNGTEKIAKEINDILVYGGEITVNLLSAAGAFLPKKNGVKIRMVQGEQK